MKRTIELNKQTKRLGLIERIQRKRKEQKADDDLYEDSDYNDLCDEY